MFASHRPSARLLPCLESVLDRTARWILNVDLTLPLQAGGKTTDHATYLVPPGSADIFFPVDFGLSARLYAAAARDATGDAAPQVTTQVLKSREFFETYANVGQTACSGGGYNPLLEDFSNTSFLLASTQEDMNSTL